jgi:hypothetical protein
MDYGSSVLGRRAQYPRIHALVFPAASSPSINSRISFDPNIFPIIFDIETPISTGMALRRERRVTGECPLSRRLAVSSTQWPLVGKMWACVIEVACDMGLCGDRGAEHGQKCIKLLISLIRGYAIRASAKRSVWDTDTVT